MGLRQGWVIPAQTHPAPLDRPPPAPLLAPGHTCGCQGRGHSAQPKHDRGQQRKDHSPWPTRTRLPFSTCTQAGRGACSRGPASSRPPDVTKSDFSFPGCPAPAWSPGATYRPSTPLSPSPPTSFTHIEGENKVEPLGFRQNHCQHWKVVY